jgi:hypothetical protein
MFNQSALTKCIQSLAMSVLCWLGLSSAVFAAETSLRSTQVSNDSSSASRVSAPANGVSVPGAGVSVPDTKVSAPANGVSVPGAGVSVPDTKVSASAVGVSASNATASAPDTRVSTTIEQSVYLDDASGDIGEGEFVSHFKPWGKDEKAVVIAILETVRQRAPGLLTHAACNGPVAIKRVSVLFLPASTSKHDDLHRAGYACIHGGDIVIADKFFLHDSPAHILVHELTHAADYGCHLSLSKEWVAFACPPISAVKSRRQSTGNNEYGLNKLVRSSGLWPSVYGCENFTEGLAEYVTAFVQEHDFPVCEQFKQTIAPKLMNISEADIQWSRNYRLGDAAFRSGRYDDAIVSFSAAAAVDPAAPLPHQYIAYSYAHKHDNAKALEHSRIAMECFEKAGITAADPFMFNAIRLRATLLTCQSRYSEAKILLDRLIEQEPMNRATRADRLNCCEKLQLTQPADQDRKAIAQIDRDLMAKRAQVLLYRPTNLRQMQSELRSFIKGSGIIIRGIDVEAMSESY